METFKLDSKIFVSQGITSFIVSSDNLTEGGVWIGYVNDEPWLEVFCNKIERSNAYFDVIKVYKQDIDFIPDYTVFKKVVYNEFPSLQYPTLTELFTLYREGKLKEGIHVCSHEGYTNKPSMWIPHHELVLMVEFADKLQADFVKTMWGIPKEDSFGK